MKKIFSDLFTFKSYQAVSFPHKKDPLIMTKQGRCKLELFQGEAGAIALITELYDNPAMSVDNACHWIAEQIIQQFPEIKPERLQVVTRYTDRESYHDIHPGCDVERLALASFVWTQIKEDNRWIARDTYFTHTTRALLGLE